mgnify:FL=1
MPGCRLGCRASRIDRNCIEKRVRAVCERAVWRVFVLAEIRLYGRIFLLIGSGLVMVD